MALTLYLKRLLSASTDGKGIKVVETDTPGTLIHTAVAGEIDMDELWLYAVNIDTSPVTLTIEWGTASPRPIVLAARSGLIQIIPGLALQNEQTVKAYASSANVVIIDGFINRISVSEETYNILLPGSDDKLLLPDSEDALLDVGAGG